MSIPPMPKGTYFISHSYKDKAVQERMVKQLPRGVRPYIFPPIMVRPDQMVSNNLIKAILQCDSMIYLDKGYSAASFWVAFERDYALRAGKPLYRYDPATESLERVEIPPLQLPIFSQFSSADYAELEKLFAIMKRDRFFDLFTPPVTTTGSKPFIDNPNDKTFETNMYKRLNQGGYMLIFWSRNANLSEHVHQYIKYGYEYFPSDNPEYHRMLFALMDNTPLPDWYFQKVQPFLTTIPHISPVQLYADKALSHMNRLDDLIVRLYWLIFRGQYPDMIGMF